MQDDEITPLITHHFDEAGETYNFLTYRFDGEGVAYMARAELFSPNEVTLTGPYDRALLLPAPGRAPEAAVRERARAYLQRRYRVVK